MWLSSYFVTGGVSLRCKGSIGAACPNQRHQVGRLASWGWREYYVQARKPRGLEIVTWLRTFRIQAQIPDITGGLGVMGVRKQACFVSTILAREMLLSQLHLMFWQFSNAYAVVAELSPQAYGATIWVRKCVNQDEKL